MGNSVKLNNPKYYKDSCDVLVIGGGTAGVIAAIQAARAGATTVLVEINTQLGGTMTTGGVAAPAYFFVGNRQIVGGIGWELVQECMELSSDKMPDYNDHSNNRPSWHVLINPYVYTLIAEEKCIESGVTIHYQEMIQSLSKDGDIWTVDFAGNMLKRIVRAKEIIDCSGDAVAVRLAGGECYRDKVSQPGTLSFQLNGYDLSKLDMEQIEKAYNSALAKGFLKSGDYCNKNLPFELFLKNRGGNMQHVFDADSSDSELITQANIAARESLMRILRFLKQQKGMENTSIDTMRTNIGVRDSWRIVGEETVRVKDYLNGKLYDDAVAWTYYFVDIHHEEGISREYIPEGVYPSIPFGALIPRGIDGMLTAGRTISSDKGAFSALRIQASCMAMGQVAGAAAALGVSKNCNSRDVSLSELKTLLREHDALVPN